MSNEDSRGTTVKFVYPESDDYKIIYANGVYGGVTMQGEIMIDFFQERHVPVKMEIRSIEDGEIGKPTEREMDLPEPTDGLVFIRERKIGITLHPDQAESIANWILDKVNQARAAMERKGQESGSSEDQI